jgi:hypothetical protein
VEARDDEDGAALVVDEKGGCLRQARSMAGFERLEKVPRVVAVAPAAPGWQVELWNANGDNDDTFFEPIAAWLVDAEGNLYPANGSNDSYLTTINPRQRSQILPPEEDRKRPGAGVNARHLRAFRPGGCGGARDPIYGRSDMAAEMLDSAHRPESVCPVPAEPQGQRGGVASARRGWAALMLPRRPRRSTGREVEVEVECSGACGVHAATRGIRRPGRS